MMTEITAFTPLTSLALGFGLGFIHAFDVDHLMAVSAMAQGKTKVSQCFRYSSRWAVGHGTVLITLGVLLLGFGFELPQQVIFLSEKLIGILLIVFGVLLVAQLFRHTSKAPTANNTPFLVGVIHGMAGNAPVIALLPALAQASMLAAISYLCLFSVGLWLSMAVFAFGLSHAQRWLQLSRRGFLLGATGVGLASVTVGVIWLRL